MAPKEDYSRADVRRKFGLSERQLQSWEKQGLVPAATVYTFSDLIAFQTLIKLRENKIPSPRDRAGAGLTAREAGLGEASAFRIARGLRRQTHHRPRSRAEDGGGERADSLRFRGVGAGRAEELSGPQAEDQPHARIGGSGSRKGWNWKRRARPVEHAVDAYKKVLELNPGAAGALVNLGTIFYRLRRFDEAERYYLDAITADPAYPLAQFNLGNLYDEQGRLPEAFEYYRRALGTQSALRGRAFQPGAALRTDRRPAESGAPLEGVPEARRLGAVGGDRAAATGTAAPGRDSIRYVASVDWRMLVGFGMAAAWGAAAPAVEFNRDVRPILSDRCFSCHGPDSAARKSPLRLDQEESARAALTAGDPAHSPLVSADHLHRQRAAHAARLHGARAAAGFRDRYAAPLDRTGRASISRTGR